MKKVGIIGGTGLYELAGLDGVQEIEIDTPFGKPSDLLISGYLGDTELIFVPRHGRGHRLLPSEVPYQANVFALKKLGVESVVSVSAVGSLQEEIHPGDFVLVDQYIDRTHHRKQSFFGEGLAAHVSMADPVCSPLRQHILTSAKAKGVRVHNGGTYICIEGPAFSTRAESNMYRSFGAHVIGMTGIPEAKLVREAEMHYASIALVTDFDCWHENESNVDVTSVLKILKANTDNVKNVLHDALPAIPSVFTGPEAKNSCGCATALQHAIITNKNTISDENRDRLSPLIAAYL